MEDKNFWNFESNVEGEEKYSEFLSASKNYRKVKDPDMIELIQLIKSAKGPSRSIRQFAKEIDVSASTLSRIMRNKAKRPLRHNLIAKIVANADPQSQIKLDALLRANGEEEDLQTGKSKHGDNYPPHEERSSKFEETMLIAVINALLKHKYTIQVKPLSSWKVPGFEIGIDYQLETNAFDGDGNDTWLFEFKHGSYVSRRFYQELDLIMCLYYCGQADAKRISFVVDNLTVFTEMKDCLESLSIPDEISVILVKDDGKVKEFAAPCKNGNPKIIFP